MSRTPPPAPPPISGPEGDAPRAWHTLSPGAALEAIGSNAERGLDPAEVIRRLARFGPNALPQAKRRGLIRIVLAQFQSPLIYLLFGAAALALVFGHRVDAATIFGVVTLNALIGAFQEGRAERSLAGLRKLAFDRARVVRGGAESEVLAQALVPGDVVKLEAGDAVPADCRLLDGTALQIAEAALTGESQPVTKETPELPLDTPLADRRSMVFAGTQVTASRARALVVATGLATEIGHITTLAEGTKTGPTPLERRVAAFGRAVMIAAVVLFALIVLLGWLRDVPLADLVLVAISQVVGMVPEGLPVAMTVALAVGVQRMAKRQAVVRRLAAVETLGSTTVICTDKTGTLTRNEMTVTAVVLPDGTTLSIEGAGYAPEGRLLRDGAPVEPGTVAQLPDLVRALILCNDAELLPPDGNEQTWRPLGDPTEVALLTLAAKAGTAATDVRAAHPRLAELPFDAAHALMATVHAGFTVLKGAPEAVLPLCDPAAQGASAAKGAAEQLAARALRVLAVAVVETREETRETPNNPPAFETYRGRARLLGLVGELDPPRPEVASAIAECHAAGVRVVMVTGDHKITAMAIARTLGILGGVDDPGTALDGRELEALSDAELASRIGKVGVFARVHPAQKLRIVEALQRAGEIVAMTGDGVNDAPALVRADVGVAMGRSGTAVAREAAEIVLGDDNFTRIVAAVEEGRVVYRNIAKTVLLLFSTALAEVAVLLLAMLVGGPPPFAAVQILWNNLVTEGLITVNLVMEPAEGDEMRRAPIPRDEPLLTRLWLVRMAFMVPAMTLSTLGWYFWRDHAGVSDAQVQAETFTLLAICEWYNVLNCRSATATAFNGHIFRNRWLLGGLVVGNLLQIAVIYWTPLGSIFRTVPIPLEIVPQLALVGSLVLWVEELRKLWSRRHPAAPAEKAGLTAPAVQPSLPASPRSAPQPAL